MAVRAFCLLAGLWFVYLAVTDSPLVGGGLGFGIFQVAALGLGALTILAGLLPARISVPYALLLVSTLVTLALAEFLLSSLLGARFYTAYAFDPRYLFRLEKGVSREYSNLPVNGGNKVVYRINSDGFRGPELERSGDAPRILVYGDSFIHAEFSELEETFPVRLEEQLEKRLGGDVEVINAGVAGYGPDQVLRRMEDELSWVEPDLVLVSLFSGNDFGDLLRNRLYRLSDGGVLEENDFRLSAEQERSIALNESEPVLRRMLGEAVSALRGGGQETVDFDNRQWIEDALAQHLAEYESYIAGENTVGAFGVDPYSADIALLPDSPSAAYKIRLMDAIVGRMKQVAEAHAVPLAVMVVPHPMDLLDGEHASGLVDKAKYPAYVPTRLSDAMVTIARDHGLPVLNLFPVFQSEDVDALFLRGGDDHWNGAGQALGAESAAAFLVENELLGTGTAANQ